MRRRRILPVFTAVFLFGGLAQLGGMVLALDGSGDEVHPLVMGCEGVPEAVSLSELLLLRGDRVDRYLAELDRKRIEIARAEARLTARLVELRAASQSPAARQNAQAAAIDEDIRRMVALYDVMKPGDAAQVMAKLPPDYAAEILMRIGPENGARIIGALDPGTAAIVTTHMGARSARHN